MPTVEKVAGGRVYVRLVGRQFEIGDEAEVTEDQAEYLCEERGDFRRVDTATDVEFDEVEDDSDADAESDASADAADGGSDGSEDDEAGSEATDGPHRDPDAVEAGDCGFVDPETDGGPCGRNAGWGRDEDDGPCKDHVDELEE